MNIDVEALMLTATAARERYNRDVRLRAMARQIAHHVVSSYESQAPLEMRDAHDLAIEVAVHVMHLFYSEDGEIKRLEQERDQAREYMERCVSLAPMSGILNRDA